MICVCISLHTSLIVLSIAVAISVQISFSSHLFAILPTDRVADSCEYQARQALKVGDECNLLWYVLVRLAGRHCLHDVTVRHQQATILLLLRCFFFIGSRSLLTSRR